MGTAKEFLNDLRTGDPLPWAMLVLLVLFFLGGGYLMATLPVEEKGEWLLGVGIAFIIGWLIAGSRR